MNIDDRIKALVRETVERERASQGPHHPSPGLLQSYLEGKLPARQEERVRDHLVVCRTCAELLLSMAKPRPRAAAAA